MPNADGKEQIGIQHGIALASSCKRADCLTDLGLQVNVRDVLFMGLNVRMAIASGIAQDVAVRPSTRHVCTSRQ